MRNPERVRSASESSVEAPPRNSTAARRSGEAASLVSDVQSSVFPFISKSASLNFRVARAIAIINSDYATQQLNLDVVGQRLGLTKSHLCRIFKREVGIGLPVYVSRVRAQAAERLLRETSLRVKEIATAVGFNYVTQLDRVFKMVFGCGPKEYRTRIFIEEF
jgi:AraC-like DNA-binding protein